MDANAYADKIERSYDDPGELKAIRAQIEADPELAADDKWRLSTRVGTHLLGAQPNPPGTP
jgi:hypothetical protein